MRLDGRDVRFLTGTDEHGQKVEKAAAEKGIDPQSFTDEISKNFRRLADVMNFSYDDFIRTTEPRHIDSCQAIWKAIASKQSPLRQDNIYLGKYAGWYAVRDEAFYTEGELEEGPGGKKIAPSGAEVEWVEEPSYFFRLSDWQDALLKFYADNPDFIAEIVIAEVEMGRTPSEFLLTHAYELLVRDGRVLGAIILLGRVMKSGVPVPAMHECLVAIHRIAQQIDVGVAPDGLLTREYVVESAPAPDELKIWVEMMNEDELLLQADDLVEALSFDREAFIPLPVPFFSELRFEDFITLLGAVDYSRVLKGQTILEAGAGGTVRTVRNLAESMLETMRGYGAVTTLIRINPELPLADTATNQEATISLFCSGLSATALHTAKVK